MELDKIKLKSKTEMNKFKEKVALNALSKENQPRGILTKSSVPPEKWVKFLKDLGYTEKEITRITKYKIENTIKLSSLIKEKYGDTIKVPIKNPPKNFYSGNDLYDKSTIDILSKILQKYGFKFKGKTPGSHWSWYWWYDGNKYEKGYYRLTGDVEDTYIEMELFPNL